MKKFRFLNDLQSVIENENVACFDVDMTLIEEISAEDFYHNDVKGRKKDIDPRTGDEFYYIEYTEHIKLLKQMHSRGRFIIVWSAAGFEWAKTICTILGIDDFVHLRMTKPVVMVDDKPIDSWTTRVYLPKLD